MIENVDSTHIQSVLGRLVQRWEKVAPHIIIGLEAVSKQCQDVLLKEGEEKRLILDRMEKAFRKRENDIERQMFLLQQKGMLPKKGGPIAKKGQNLHKS